MTTLEITVKTLDSQNHKFDVGDELTVKQFKEKIADTVAVSAEAQRLIYCGRVLQDDKKLSEYGLDKKVVHLVQKLPPSQRPQSSGGGTSSSRTGAGSSGTRRSGGGGGGSHPRDSGTSSMYLGALAFPSDIFSVQGTQEMIQSAAQSRLSVVRNMLQSAQNCVATLEDPNASPAAPPAPPPSATAATETDNDPFRVINRMMEGGSEVEGTFTTSVPLLGNLHHHAQEAAADVMAGAVSAAVAGALSAIVSAVGTTITSSHNIHVMHETAPADTQPSQQQGTSTSEAGRSSDQSSEALGADDMSTSGGSAQASGSRASPPADNNGSPQGRQGALRTSSLAEALDEVMAIQDRLRPFMQRTVQLLRDDPTLQAASPELQEAQRVFNLVSETMHLLSHAYHSLSDLSVSLTRPPPRSVGVRSLVLQPTAVLQTGIPIQAQINVMANRVSPSARSNSSSPTSQASGQTTQASSQPTQATGQPPQATGQPSQTSGQPTSTSAPPTASTTPIRQPSMPNLPNMGRRQFHLGGQDVELIMEVGPGGITLEHASSVPITPQAAAAVLGGQPLPGRGNRAAVPPPELLQNIIQAMAAQMVGVSRDGRVQTGFAMPTSQAASSPASTGASTSAPSASASAPGQNSTARGNTATHPTTSTQTRSTARPHVHLAPVNWPGPQNFDPFLPCNSHHIQPLLRLQRPQQTQTPSGGQAARTQAANQQARPGSGAAPRTGTINIAQQIFGEIMGPGLDSQSTLTVADFLASMPDYTHSQGESFFTDLFVTMARHFTFRDLVQVSMRQSAPLNRLRDPLRQFITEELLHGGAATTENIAQAVDRLLREIQPYLEVVRASQLREDINFEASVRRFCQARLPEVINLITNTETETSQFGAQLMRLSGSFVRDLASLTLMCCHGGRQGLERILHRYVQVLTGDLEPSIQQWTSANSRLPLRSFVQGLVPNGALEEFLVRAQPATTEALPASAPPPVVTVDATPTVHQDVEEAMECDGDEFVLAMDEPASVPVTVVPPSVPVKVEEDEAAAAVLPPMQLDAESCDVVVGTEQWHAGIDPDWVPVITRDIQRQRRQSEQPPFSDAYLAGMSSKRRKIIASGKPQGTVSQVITESVAQAAGAAGVAGAEQIAQAAGADPTLQAAYKEEVKRTVSQQLASNPEFNPDRYPNANKYFNPSPK